VIFHPEINLPDWEDVPRDRGLKKKQELGWRATGVDADGSMACFLRLEATWRG
jgi:hypothetical protein